MDRSLVKKSKRLSLILRHDPASAGLSLEEGGWVRVDKLLKAVGLTREELERIVSENDKKRFSFDGTGTKIRANQGHSVQVDLDLEPREPPEFLYHGTSRDALDSIFDVGITRGRRQHVHLSVDEKTAESVGGRHGKPIVLLVEALKLFRSGQPFYLSENGVWLVDSVPVGYFDIRRYAVCD